jgi:hypothetical protein
MDVFRVVLSTRAVGSERLCDCRYTCAESSFRSIFRPTPKRFHDCPAERSGEVERVAHVQFSSMLRTDSANSEKWGESPTAGTFPIQPWDLTVASAGGQVQTGSESASGKRVPV